MFIRTQQSGLPIERSEPSGRPAINFEVSKYLKDLTIMSKCSYLEELDGKTNSDRIITFFLYCTNSAHIQHP
jgi:hypothetical protein